MMTKKQRIMRVGLLIVSIIVIFTVIVFIIAFIAQSRNESLAKQQEVINEENAKMDYLNHYFDAYYTYYKVEDLREKTKLPKTIFDEEETKGSLGINLGEISIPYVIKVWITDLINEQNMHETSYKGIRIQGLFARGDGEKFDEDEKKRIAEELIFYLIKPVEPDFTEEDASQVVEQGQHANVKNVRNLMLTSEMQNKLKVKFDYYN